MNIHMTTDGKEQLRDYKRKHYEEHKEEYKKRAKKYREEHKEEMDEKRREYIRTHREGANKRSRRYINKLRENAIKVLGGKCMMCGDTDSLVLQFHHIEPLFRRNGDSHKKNNENCTRTKKFRDDAKQGKIELLCANCHIRRHYLGGSKNGRKTP